MLSTQKLVVGIFRNRSQVEWAINELHQIGFDNRQIWFAKHGSSIGEMLKKTKNLCKGQNVSTNGIYDDLVNVGIPPEDARHYQSEFEAGRSIVAILNSDTPLVATSILIRNGGYIVNEHFAQFTNYGQNTSKSVNIDIHFLKELVRLTRCMVSHLLASLLTSLQGRPTRDGNAEPRGPNKHIAPSTNHETSKKSQKSSKDLINA